MNREFHDPATMTRDDEYIPVGRVSADRAIDRLGGSRSLFANVVGRFLDDSAGNFATLRQAVVRGEFSGLKRAAHSLKGLAAMCGAESVHETLAKLEAFNESDGHAAARELLAHLEMEMDEAHHALAPFRSGAGS